MGDFGRKVERGKLSLRNPWRAYFRNVCLVPYRATTAQNYRYARRTVGIGLPNWGRTQRLLFELPWSRFGVNGSVWVGASQSRR
jgi:hypothetical protein